MQNRQNRRPELWMLLQAIDNCQTIGEICALVEREHIVIQMKSQQAASNIPFRPLPENPAISPLESLRSQVREAAIAMYRPKVKREEALPQSDEKRELLEAIDACPTIDKLFELVRDRHIVIQMKSQNAASNIPFQPLPENPALSPLETLRSQVRDAVDEMYRPKVKREEAPRSDEKRELLEAIDTCPTIDKLFELVRDRHIVIQMKSQNAASNIPFQPLPENPALSPLETLRSQVRDAVDEMFRSDDKQELINAVKTCPSIDKLFELVRDRHIVIQMKSQRSASCLPQRQISSAELMPDTTPLERLRQQVLEAVIYG